MTFHLLLLSFLFLLSGTHAFAQEEEREMTEAENLASIERMAATGDTLAQLMLGSGYLFAEYGLKQNTNAGVDWLLRASNQGSKVASYLLGALYSEDDLMKQDIEKSKLYYLRSANAGFPPAQHELGLLYLKHGADFKDRDEAIKWFEQSYANGNKKSATLLGACYMYENETPENIKRGIELLKTAAETDSFAAFVLFQVYDEGEFAEENEKLAFEYCKKSVELGHTEGIEYLAEFYENGGDGIPMNKEEAKRLNALVQKRQNKSKEKPETASEMYALAKRYKQGEGVPVDYEKSVFWLEKAAALNHAYARNALGLMCLNGMGVAQNDQKAFEMFTLSSKSLYSEATYNLAQMHEQGRGTPKDPVKAFSLYKQCSDKGHRKSMLALVRCHKMGIGTPKDPKKAALLNSKIPNVRNEYEEW